MTEPAYDAELTFGRDAELLLEQQVVDHLQELDIIAVKQVGDTRRYHVRNTYRENEVEE